jgi:hypothetical protein
LMMSVTIFETPKPATIWAPKRAIGSAASI